MSRVLHAVYRSFDVAFPFVNWTFLIGGIVGFLATVIGVAPPLGDTLWGRVVACIGWALVAKDGYSDLQEDR